MGFTEKSDFEGGLGVNEKPMYRGNCLKKGGGGAWIVCRFKGRGEGGTCRERVGGAFEVGWYPNAHYAVGYYCKL